MFVAKGLTQECDGASLHGPATGFFVVVSSDENDGDATTLGSQMALELQSVHARHLYVKDETRGMAQPAEPQEAFSRCKGRHSIAERLNEKTCRPANGLVVVNHRN